MPTFIVGRVLTFAAPNRASLTVRLAVTLAGVTLAGATPAGTLGAQQQITLKQAVEMAQNQGYSAKAAIATRDAARGRDRAFGASLLPRVSLRAIAPEFQRDISGVVQPDGSTAFTPVEQTRSTASMAIAQKLPFTGGDLSVTSSLQRYQVTGSNRSLTWSSAPVTFRLEQPIFRPNTIRWDMREQDVRASASERQYLEAREAIAGQTTVAFFDYYVAKRTLENEIKNASINDTLYTLNKGRLEVGKIGENDLLQSELALLRSRAALDNARLEFDRAQAQFRLAINVAPGTPIDVVVSTEIPHVEADTTMAVAQALQNRAQITDLELQGIQAQRRIAEARLNSGVGATVNASLGFNQTAPDINLAYQDLLQAQRFTLDVSIPLVQWGARSAAVQAARADQRRVEATSRATREQVAQDAHFAALQLAQAERNLAVSAKADTVAQKRFDVAYSRYVIGRIGVDNLYIAQSEKDQAVNQYLLALRTYWAAYYRLRQLTLFDFETGRRIE